MLVIRSASVKKSVIFQSQDVLNKVNLICWCFLFKLSNKHFHNNRFLTVYVIINCTVIVMINNNTMYDFLIKT